uniref:Uncharacterized protein n=1 Tax=Tetranychus urticae TaxID=32264 RepID=T1KEW8_TETUR
MYHLSGCSSSARLFQSPAANNDQVDKFLHHGYTPYKGKKFLAYIPFGLKPEDHLLPKLWDADEVPIEESKFACHWCYQCEAVGAPGHDSERLKCPPGSDHRPAAEWNGNPRWSLGNPRAG